MMIQFYSLILISVKTSQVVVKGTNWERVPIPTIFDQTGTTEVMVKKNYRFTGMGENRGSQGFRRDFLQDNEDTSKLIGSDGSILHQPLQINGNHLILMSTDFTCQMAATLVHFLLLPHDI